MSIADDQAFAWKRRADLCCALENRGAIRQQERKLAGMAVIKPTLLHAAELALSTSLKRIEPHRLQALVVEDLSRYPGSSSGAINRRIGPEISYKNVKRALDVLCQAGAIRYEGARKGRKYWVAG